MAYKTRKKKVKKNVPEGISMKDGKAVVDQTLCVGCGVCQQLCAFDAIGGEQ